MANDLNQCNFIGRLGKDVDMRYGADGKAVAGISVGVGSQWKNPQGEKVEATEWVKGTAFGKLAEIMGQYLKKGSKVYISGRMKTDKYQDKQTGVDKYSTGIIINQMQMLDSKPQTNQQQEVSPAGSNQGQTTTHTAGGDFDDDQIPF